MNRSPNPNAAIRERVDVFEETPKKYIYVWPYDTEWVGRSGFWVRCIQADIDMTRTPPAIEVVHIDETVEPEKEVRDANHSEINSLLGCIVEDFGIEAIGLEALREFAASRNV